MDGVGILHLGQLEGDISAFCQALYGLDGLLGFWYGLGWQFALY